MAIQYPAAGSALRQQRQQLVVALQAPALHGRQQLLLGRLQRVGPGLGEVLDHGGAQRGGGARLVAAGGGMAGRRGGLLAGQFAAQGAHQGAVQLAPRGDIAQQLRLVEAPHLHGVIEQLPTSITLPAVCEDRPARGRGDRHYREVELGGEALVEGQFLFAEETALFQGGKIQEAEIHRLLDLVGVFPGQDDPGDMGFPQYRCAPVPA